MQITGWIREYSPTQIQNSLPPIASRKSISEGAHWTKVGKGLLKNLRLMMHIFNTAIFRLKACHS